MRWIAISVYLALAAPAVAQEAPPVAARPVRVFFDWGKPELTQDARAILDAFASSYRGGRLLLTGHSDRSGPAALNRGGAYRRAEAVRDYLAGKGVSRSALQIASEGEARPLVPTEDGVREVQNRRVEIIFLP
jgi:outer membrane protein OmpA-like peptidoglycan-associated protein